MKAKIRVGLTAIGAVLILSAAVYGGYREHRHIQTQKKVCKPFNVLTDYVQNGEYFAVCSNKEHRVYTLD